MFIVMMITVASNLIFHSLNLPHQSHPSLPQRNWKKGQNIHPTLWQQHLLASVISDDPQRLKHKGMECVLPA